MTTSTTTTSRSRVETSDLARFAGFVSATATRLAGTSRARRAGAEYDDLYQEGMLSVWLSLQRNVNPILVVENRMRDWIKLQARQRQGDPVPYEQLLPLEDVASGGPE